MKICAIQGTIAMILFGMAMAHNNYAQLLDRRISFNLQDVSIERALTEIEGLADVQFFYSVDQLNVEEEISFEAIDRTLGEVLDELLGPYKIKYKVHEKESTITLKKESEVPESDARVGDDKTVGIAVPYSVETITGMVSDFATQQPMAGVNVIVKGTTEGTTTDSEGKFSIWAEQKDVLVFSFIGYTTFEALVSGKTVIDVALQEDIKSLKEVEINAGYYRTSKVLQTGNITKIESQDIANQPVSNPLAALQGRVPGLEIIQQTGVPGGNFKVRIRGTNSIANGNDPLFIIDGVPFTSATMSLPETSGSIAGPGGTNPLNGINPADIESIEVLKDADATAIYGSRGSNGVILITTKKGQPGKTKVDFNFYTGAGKVARKMDLLNRKQYLEMRNEAFANDNITPTVADARDLLEWDTTRFTNWQKKLIGGTAQTTDAQLSVSGGDKNTQFLVGSGYHKETTVFPGDNADQRVSLHTSITNSSLNQKLTTSFSFSYSVNNTNLLKQDLTDQAMLLPPVAPALYDEAGNLSWENWTSTYQNPLAYTKRMYEAKTQNLLGNGVIRYAVLPNLEVKSNLGYTSIGMKAITTTPISSQFPDPSAQNSTSFSNTSFQNWIVEPQINWKPKLGGGKFDILAGTTFLDQTNDGLSQTGVGFSSEALMKNLSSASTRTLGTNYYSRYRYHAVFGRINYSWGGKYIVNLTGRRDGSSRFGPGKQFATFGAIGAAWIFSEESFISNSQQFFSFGKLRTSYGTTGNDQLGDYQYLDSYSSSGGAYQGTIGLKPDRLSNPNYAWETNNKFEVGLDLGFLDNRILSSISYYNNRSSNQLVGFPLPTTTGFTTIQGNFPATIQNTGVEVELNTRNVETSNFNWSTSFNLSIPRNKLVEFPNIESFPAYDNRYAVGEPLGIRKLYNYTGIDPITGIYMFEDVNGDGAYNFEERQTVKFVGQDFYGGFQNSFRYKSFQLDILLQCVKQTGNNYIRSFGTPGVIANTPDFVMDRWKNESDDALIQRFSQSGDPLTAYSRLVQSQHAISDASFIRVKNLSFSYSLPQAWVQKLHIENMRVFIQGQNLLTISDYMGLDPEIQSSTLPPLRVITVGIHITL